MEHFEEREWDLALRSRLAVALEGQRSEDSRFMPFSKDIGALRGYSRAVPHEG